MVDYSINGSGNNERYQRYVVHKFSGLQPVEKITVYGRRKRDNIYSNGVRSNDIFRLQTFSFW